MDCPLRYSSLYCESGKCFYSKPISEKEETPLCDYPYYKGASIEDIKNISQQSIDNNRTVGV